MSGIQVQGKGREGERSWKEENYTVMTVAPTSSTGL